MTKEEKHKLIIELAEKKADEGEFIHSAMLTNSIGAEPVWKKWKLIKKTGQVSDKSELTATIKQ